MERVTNRKLENNGFGPISTPREKKKCKLAAFLVTVMFLAALTIYKTVTQGLRFTQVLQENVDIFCGIVSAAILGEFIRRMCLFAEEYHHVDSRYKGSKRKALEACISQPSKLTNYVFVVTTAVYLYSWIHGITKYYGGLYLATAMFGSVVTFLINMKSQQSKVELSDLSEMEDKHVADGLAWAYYFGYLNLLFQNWDAIYERAVGDYQISGKDIRDVINRRNYKLFIVIPKDGLCFHFIRQKDERIRDVAKMPELRLMRAGVQERRYENTVYEIKMGDGRKQHVLLEFATPLLSMYEMTRDERTNFDEDHLGEQVMQFYTKLKMILNSDENCEGKFELILLGGNEDPRAPKLGDIIWKKLEDEDTD